MAQFRKNTQVRLEEKVIGPRTSLQEIKELKSHSLKKTLWEVYKRTQQTSKPEEIFPLLVCFSVIDKYGAISPDVETKRLAPMSPQL